MNGPTALRDLDPPVKVFAAATGAGAGIQSALWSVPGSSAFLAGAAFPYAGHETARFLGFAPARFCDDDAALELAIAAYLRARETCIADAAAPERRPAPAAIGLGLTASVASVAPHRGDHRIFAATVGARGATLWSARLPKGTGAAWRFADGMFADRLGLHALFAAAGVDDDLPRETGTEIARDDVDDARLKSLLLRRPTFGPGDARGPLAPEQARAAVLLPGSFDPFHDGHRMIAEAVERQSGRRVVYTLTADPIHKPRLRAIDLLDRVASVRGGGETQRTVVLTERDPLFVDKARQFPGAGIALGVDAVLRMLDPRWGPAVPELLATFRALGTRFHVVGRVVDGCWTTIDDVEIPAPYRDLFARVEGRLDISSSALRREGMAERAG